MVAYTLSEIGSVHISVCCPSCQRRYHLEPALRGSKIRCPNPICRQIFDVPDAESEPDDPHKDDQAFHKEDVEILAENGERRPSFPEEKASEGSQTLGSVGDMIPILPAEEVTKSPQPDVPQPASPGASWATAHVEQMVPMLPAEAMEIPQQSPETPSWQLPPPVRVRSETAKGTQTQEGTPLEHSGRATRLPERKESGGYLETVPPAPSRRIGKFLAAFVVIAIIIFAGLGGFGYYTWLESEKNRYQEALKDYESQKYASAQSKFEQIAKSFSNSDHVATYQFMTELSGVRDQAYQLQADPQRALQSLRAFVKAHDKDPILNQYLADVWETYHKLVLDLVDEADKDQNLAMLDHAETIIKEADNYNPDKKTSQPRVTEATSRMNKVRQEIAQRRQHKQFLEELSKLVQKPPPDPFRAVHRFVAQAAEEQPAFENDAEVKDLLAQLARNVAANVKWVAIDNPPAQTPPSDRDPGLLAALPLINQAAVAPGKPEVIFALARGVLYALDDNTGEVRWTTRAGVDATNLPVRLPGDVVLVSATDANLLTARNVRDGKVVWQCRLSGPCLGKPLAVPAQAPTKIYVPTYDGKVYEFDALVGKPLGWFELGQPLTVGGAYQEKAKRVYFPAESDCIFVLDPENRKQPCPALLPSSHPAGAIRSEPILINREELRRQFEQKEASWPDLLAFEQADGHDGVKLRAFELRPDGPSLLSVDPPLPGITWFPPYHDPERLVQATDAGMVGVFGIRQFRNLLDEPLFLDFKKPVLSESKNPRPARAQIVKVQEDNFWILANGELNRFHFDRFGRRLVPVWKQSLGVGSPLQPVQADENGQTLFLTTQSTEKQVFLATAVDAEEGRVLWQRQLGLISREQPLTLKNEILFVDQGGGLILFDSQKIGQPADLVAPKEGMRRWADDLPQIAGRVHLLPGEDGVSAYEIVCTLPGPRLVVRHYQEGKEKREWQTALPARIHGTPALTPGGILLPLANGQLVRQPLQGGQAIPGPPWRAHHADEGAPGHATYLGNDHFLVTDGSRTVKRFSWPADGMWKLDKEVALPARIIAAPLFLSPVEEKGEAQVCIADAEGTLHLLQSKDLQLVHQWKLDGHLTEGPFRRGTGIGCVIDRRRLVWLDPVRKRQLWEYSAVKENNRPAGNDEIVGQPQLVGDLVLVAHTRGWFVALDPSTGQSRGSYRLHSKMAPTVAPIPFGTESAFVPLADGTIFLLPLKSLQNPAK